MSDLGSTQRVLVSYIDKSREFYLARGHANPYRWATREDTPFASLVKPLSESRVALVTTASRTSEDWRAREVYAAPTQPAPEALHTNHLSWHKEATHTRDVESFLPIRRLEEYVTDGRIGSLSPRFYGVKTDFSQRQTIDEYAPAVLDLCHADAVDAVLLVAL